MFKKLLLFSTMAIIGGCETINQANQCDPEKNYIISNPQAMEEYKKLREKKEVLSIYSENIPDSACTNNSCVIFDSKSFSFYEKKFNTPKTKGVYTINAYNNYNGDCEKDGNGLVKNDICYRFSKNSDGDILSKYKLVLDTSYKDRTVISFVDMSRNIKLYEYSSQIYSNKAIGGFGFSSCPKYKNNPLNDFDPMDFPSVK